MVRKSLDGNLVKTAHAKTQYTEKQLEDLIKCSNTKEGYLHWCKNFMWVQHPTKGRMKFNPYDFQVRLMDNYHNNRFSIAMCARQTGKTTCAAGYLLWYAMFHKDQETHTQTDIHAANPVIYGPG